MVDRARPPVFSRSFTFVLPTPEIIQAGSHNFVVLSGVHQDVFKFDVVFKAGKWFEPKSGLAHFTSLLLNKGTSTKSAKTIAELLDFHGAQVEITSGYDFVTVSLYGLKKNIESVVPLFVEILSDPVFPSDELDLQKQIFLQNLEINEKKNSFVASKLLRKNIFGAGHPYGGSAEREDVEAISARELQQYFNSQFSPHEIYAVGNFDRRVIQWCVDQFSALKKSSSSKDVSFTVRPGEKKEYIEKAESVQSSIRLGKSTINRGHADYFPLLLVNHTLGGYFGSRLMKNVREKKGLTYGIYSSLSPFRNDCLLSIGADVNKNNLGVATEEIKKELQLLCNELLSDEELDVARNHFLGGLQLEVANLFSALDKIKGLRLNQLGDDYYKNLFGEVERIKPRQLMSIAQKYFATEWVEVSVG